MPNEFLDRVREDSEDAADITVYDIADRMSGGMQISEPGQREVASELLRVREQVRLALVRLYDDARINEGIQMLLALAASMGLPA